MDMLWPAICFRMHTLVLTQPATSCEGQGKSNSADGLIITIGLRRPGLTVKAQGWHGGGHRSPGSWLPPKAQDRPFSESGQAWLYLRQTPTY